MIQRIKNFITHIKSRNNKIKEDNKSSELLSNVNKNLLISIVERSLFLCMYLIERNNTDPSKVKKYTYIDKNDLNTVYFVVSILLKDESIIFFNLPYIIESSVGMKINLWNYLLPITTEGSIQDSNNYESYVTGNKYSYYEQIIRNYTL